MKYEVTAERHGQTNSLASIESLDLGTIQQTFEDIIKYCYQYEQCAFAVRVDDPYFMYCADTKTTVSIRPVRK